MTIRSVVLALALCAGCGGTGRVIIPAGVQSIEAEGEEVAWFVMDEPRESSQLRDQSILRCAPEADGVAVCRRVRVLDPGAAR